MSSVDMCEHGWPGTGCQECKSEALERRACREATRVVELEADNEKLRALLKRVDEYLAAKGVSYEAKIRREVRGFLTEQGGGQ